MASARRSALAATRAPLMREWIYSMLYDPVDGYFSKHKAPVAPMTSPIPFPSLETRHDYLAYVAAQYATLETKWLTPSEIFSPYLGRAIANHIASLGVTRVVEIGSGTGTLARDIVDSLKAREYADRKFEFVSIEISKSLSERQAARMEGAGHADVYRSRHADALLESTWRQFADEQPTLIVGLEVLDNLPHDKVQVVDGVWHQTRVQVQQREAFGETLREALEPVTDDGPILRALDAYERVKSAPAQRTTRDAMFKWLLDATETPDPVWLPTGAEQLVRAVASTVPNHELLLGDFDFLPGVAIAGEFAPIVSSTVDGKARDRGELLSAPRGSVDIFFPTDFRLLAAMYEQVGAGGCAVEIFKAHEFLGNLVAGDLDVLTACTLADGSIPLLSDYANSSFARLSSTLHV